MSGPRRTLAPLRLNTSDEIMPSSSDTENTLTFKTFDSGLIKATRMMPPELNIPVNTGP